MVSILLDENIPKTVQQSLQSAGYDTVRLKNKGISDSEVLADAKSQNRTVLTFDRDFANTVRYPPQDYSGIIVMRRKSCTMTTSDVEILIKRLLEHLMATRSMIGQLFVVERAKIRQYSPLTSDSSLDTI